MSLYGIVDAVNFRLLALLLAAAVHGRITAALFQRFTNGTALRAAMNRIIAHVMEFRLFTDEPSVIWGAQKDLLFANARVLRQIAAPMLLSAAIITVLWLPMHRYFGRGPLGPGEATLAEAGSVTADLDLIAPFGATVETPPLRLPAENKTVWRIRALSPVSGEFRTTPARYPVTVHYPPAKYMGLPWPLFFFAASGIRMLLLWRKVPRTHT